MSEERIREGSNEKQLIMLMRKQLKQARILSALMAVLLVLLSVGGLLMYMKTAAAIKSVEETVAVINDEVVPVLKEFDAEAFNDGVKNFSDAVEQLDIEALNGAVKELTEAANDFDVKSLNEAIDNLNAAVKLLASLSGLFSGGNNKG